MSFPFISDVVNTLFGTHWHVPIPVFGLMVMAAVTVAAFVARKEVIRYEGLAALPQGTRFIVTEMVFVSVTAGIIGARIFHILEYVDQFVANPASMIFSRGGFSIYGGLSFGIIAAAIFLRRRQVPVLPMLDATAPSMMLGYAVGRLGCQLSGDGDWGVAADLASKPGWLPDWVWAQTYENNIAGVLIPPPGVYPTPLYEAAMALALFGVLWSLRSHRQRTGLLFSGYMLLAGFERLLIEKIRINAQYHVFDFAFTQAEAISVVLIVVGCIGVMTTLRARSVLPKVAFAAIVLAALSACVRL